ncbi:hypothetical protein M011DRAFT_522004 [Sporormia fimetaria CBS 119925]|uniref:Life-span regulatory factor-domain-containing protein n=1 Tax=Sporormia fimetaria CBS 119925 TaxID=1340428 RepID=A0A6A6UX79_9PLEO|nr:hypothetical protein M011DRAFT_522004 [Sporormia fimetaria CBS 119925]
MPTHHIRHPSASKRPQQALVWPNKPANSSKKKSVCAPKKKAAPPTDNTCDDDDLMATSFLQYCTTCEKQIITPSNIVLYCSERCRNIDNNKSPPRPADWPPDVMSSSSTSLESQYFPDIVPPCSPTAPSKRSSWALSEKSTDESALAHEAKPKKESEAHIWLRQFHSNPDKTFGRPIRPRIARATTSHGMSSTAPSLSHTPTSSVSYSLPYTPSARPLPPRTNPHGSSYGAKSTDLLNPLIYSAPSTPPQYSFKSAPLSHTSTPIAEGTIVYEKSPVPPVLWTDGSLKQLLTATPH